jgi:hypothetical protein
VFLLMLWNLFPARSGAVVLVVYSAGLWTCDVLIPVFSYCNPRVESQNCGARRDGRF